MEFYVSSTQGSEAVLTQKNTRQVRAKFFPRGHYVSVSAGQSALLAIFCSLFCLRHHSSCIGYSTRPRVGQAVKLLLPISALAAEPVLYGVQ